MASRIGKRLSDRTLEGDSPIIEFLNRELVPIVRVIVRIFSERCLEGSGSPEGAVTGSPGATYQNTDGGAGASFWVKESGVNTNTGWVAK